MSKQSLQSRLEALESAAKPAGIELIIVRKVISANFPGAEASVASLGGVRYTRAVDESEDQFRGRLVTIAERLRASSGAPVRVIMSPFEEDL